MTPRKTTNDPATATSITAHGSMRFRCSRARRGPRPTAELTVLRAARTASVTRAEPVAGAAGELIACVDAAAGVRTAARAIAETLAVPVAGPTLTGIWIGGGRGAPPPPGGGWG